MESAVARIESLAEDGVFGKGRLVEVRINSSDGKGAQFASELCFLEVVLQEDGATPTSLPIVVKSQVPASSRGTLESDVPFAIEAAMYKTVLSGLGVNQLGLAPEVLFCHVTSGLNPDQDIIVLEDLRPAGYKVTPNLFLDYDHVALTMRKLGEFHGLSYEMKQSPNGISTLLNELPPKTFTDAAELFTGGFLRGLEPLMSQEKDGVAKKVYDKLSAMIPMDVFKSFHEPEEPFAVIIHGDFNKNNILYSYDDKDRLKSVKFFDFATCCYADPSIDIAFFLYMNTSPAFREEHWDDALTQYWEGLTTIARDPGFTFTEFTENFAKRAVFGYLPCCFYLPILLFPEMTLSREDFDAMTPKEKYDFSYSAGGQKVTDAVSIIAQHLYKRGYLERYLLKYQ